MNSLCVCVVKKIGNDWYVFQCGALYRQRIRCTLGRAAMFDSSAYRAVVPSCSGEQLHCSFAFYEPSGGILQKGIKAEQKFLGERHSDWWRNSVRYPSSVPRQIMIGTRYGRLVCGAAPGAVRFSRCFSVRQTSCVLRSENQSRMLQSCIGRKTQPVHRQAVKIARFPVVKKSLSWLPIISKKFSMHRSTMSR